MSEVILDGVTFEVNIESGNAALVQDPNAEVIRILQKIIAVLADNPPASGVGGVVKDINGNTVGDWGLYVETKQQDDEGELDLPYRDVNV
jgi:hypothetical protein